MDIRRLRDTLIDFTRTLKFRVVAISLLLVVVSTALTTAAVLSVAGRTTADAFVDNEATNAKRLADVLATHVQTLKFTLTAASRRLNASIIHDRAKLRDAMASLVALDALFGSVAVTDADGAVMLELLGMQTIAVDASLGDRPYFAVLKRKREPIASSGVMSRLSGQPIVVVAVPLLDERGRFYGALSGTLHLGGGAFTSGFLPLLQGQATLVVVDEDGQIIAHPDGKRIMQPAREEPGLGEFLSRSVAESEALPLQVHAERTDTYLTAIAPVAGTGWILASVLNRADALSAISAGHAVAWKIGSLMAIVAAAVIVFVMSWLMQPVERLRQRAHQVLIERDDFESNWPSAHGEIGELSRVFLHILRERSAVEGSTMQLLSRLQAVLDNASVGIAFTRAQRFELTSHTFCSLLSYETIDLMGESVRVIFSSEADYEALDASVLAAFVAGESFNGEALIRRKDGTLFWGHLLARALDPDRLDQGTIWILDDISEQHELREQLTWTATHDALTGLVNRREFDRRLDIAVARANDAPFCALFIDLDRFKAVNDVGGHAAGDRLLCDLAHIIDQSVRNDDTVARLGGDEFAVMLDHCPLSAARRISEDIRRAIECYRLTWEGQDFSVGSSIGLVYIDGRFSDARDVMAAADGACYAAKRAGRNQVCEYDPDSPVAQIPIV